MSGRREKLRMMVRALRRRAGRVSELGWGLTVRAHKAKAPTAVVISFWCHLVFLFASCSRILSLTNNEKQF